MYSGQHSSTQSSHGYLSKTCIIRSSQLDVQHGRGRVSPVPPQRRCVWPLMAAGEGLLPLVGSPWPNIYGQRELDSVA